MKVEFKDERSGQSFDIIINSHYTCIFGKDSGEGKTEYFNEILTGLSEGTVKVISEYPFYCIDIQGMSSLEPILNNPERSIYLLDEASVLKGSHIVQMNKSKHLFVLITRTVPLRGNYPLDGIYFLTRCNGWFKSSPAELPMADDVHGTLLVTESCSERSEHELLSVYYDNVTAAGGRDRIERKLRNTSEKITVFADLGNIGAAYFLLRKRCEQNKQISFYPYKAFEQLLCDSPLVKNLGRTFSESVFDFLSEEQYYEAMLQYMTEGTPVKYKHGVSLPKVFLDCRNYEKIFNSEIGQLLYNDIKMQKDSDDENVNFCDAF